MKRLCIIQVRWVSTRPSQNAMSPLACGINVSLEEYQDNMLSYDTRECVANASTTLAGYLALAQSAANVGLQDHLRSLELS